MSPQDAHKLLGGYATGTLTPEEERALFQAALQNQELFDALAREQALRDVLGDPLARAQLLAAVQDAPAPWYRRWLRPVPVAVMATALAVLALVAVRESAPKPAILAKVKLPPLRREATESAIPILPPPPELKPAAAPVLPPLVVPAPPPPAPPAVQPQAARAAQANAFVNQDGVIGGLLQPMTPVHGMVTDSTGAAIRSATVEVKSIATGEISKASTNERGEFDAATPAGRAYQVSAAAPGFRPTTVSEVAPATGAPATVNLRLDAGQVAEAVAVRAAPPLVMGGIGGAGGGARKADSSAPLGLQYHVLRRDPGGNLVELTAGGEIATGATVMLQVTPNADGYLRVTETNGRTLVDRAAAGMQMLSIQLPTSNKPARVEYQLFFSRRPFPTQDLTTTVAITLNFQ